MLGAFESRALAAWSGLKCGSIDNAHHAGRAHYRRCNGCQAKFKVTHGTPFEGTHLPMRAWFIALYLVAASSKGVSSVKLAEHLGIGQKTAWFLGQRIRRMMEDKDGLLQGLIEVDKTYLGGKKRKKRQASKRDPDDNQSVGRSGTRKSMATVATAHVNTAESFNATLKRAWVGVFHWFSIKHTDRYLSEVSFRWNQRKPSVEGRLAGLFTGKAARLRWKEPTA